MAHDVFISYASEDKITADAVCARLESHRIRCWIAPRDVLPSMDYGQALMEAIRQSRLVVLVFSARSNDSPHVKREVERAVSNGIPILPFRIEDVAPSSSLEFFIAGSHWLDALTPPLERHLERLAETVELLLSRAGTPPVVSREPEPPIRGPAAPSPVLVALGAAGSALLRQGLVALRMAGRLLRYTAVTAARRPLPSALAAAGICAVVLVAWVVVAMQGGGGNRSHNGPPGAIALVSTTTTPVATNTPKPAATPSVARTTPTVAGKTPTVSGKTPTVAPGTPHATQGASAAGAAPPMGEADQFAMVASPDCVAPGGRIEATWTATDLNNDYDLVALFPSGAQNTEYEKYPWQWVHTVGGNAVFPAPETPGAVEVRLVRKGSHLAASNPVTVRNGCPFASTPVQLKGYSATATSDCVAPGGRIEATWTAADLNNDYDLVALFPSGAQNTEYSEYPWQYVHTLGGGAVFPAPETPGMYEVRLVRKGINLASTNPVTVSNDCQQ
jgi:hypothetical protein